MSILSIPKILVSQPVNFSSVLISLILKPFTENGSVGTVMSHIELAGFIIFGCLSTFHPLLEKFSNGTEGNSGSNSFSLKAHDVIGDTEK
jgi:hypothetical protein